MKLNEVKKVLNQVLGRRCGLEALTLQLASRFHRYAFRGPWAQKSANLQRSLRNHTLISESAEDSLL